MNPTLIRKLRYSAVATLLASTPAIGHAQTAPANPERETVELPSFTVQEEQDNAYRSRQALSTSRVATSLQDIPQSVSVVTGEFMQDTMSMRMLDAAKYMTPVVESTLPVGGDRYMIRGFQVSHEFIDGTEISGQDGYSASLMPYNIERVEIIKGPNAILVPGGSPGGQFNPITKSPLGKDQTSVTLELAQYYTNALSVDVNRVLSKGDSSLAARLVLAYWNSEGYLKNQFRTGYMIAPSVAWQFLPKHKLVVKGEFMQNREAIISGLPIDISVGSDDYARIITGLPRDWTFGDKDDKRHRATERVTLEVTSNWNENITSRLQVMGNHVVREDYGGMGAAIVGFNPTRNPNTGKYEPGVSWSVNNTGATAVATSTNIGIPAANTTVFSRSTNAVDLFYTEGHVKYDVAARYNTDYFDSTTIAGVAANSSKVQFKTYGTAARPNVPVTALDTITYPAWNYPQPSPTVGGNRTGKQTDDQLYVYQTLGFLKNHIIASGGYSWFNGTLKRIDNNGIPPADIGDYDLSTGAKSIGLTVKPIKEIAFFGSLNTTGGAMPSSLNPGTYGSAFRASSGEQKEFGVKTDALNGRLTGSFAYFDIKQQNYPVPNSEYYTLIAQGREAEALALQNPLYLDLNSKGWEVEAMYAVNQNLTLIGNYTKFKMRQPVTEVRVRAVPDQSGAIYADYRFTSGALRGWGFNVGLDYKDDVAGENATGYTTTKPLPGGVFVPNQPTFLVAGRTLANVGITYRTEQWTARLQVNNLADKDYILAAGSRTAAVVGDPRNVKLSVTYKY